MREKIIAELLKIFVGLSNKQAEGIADKLLPKITEEAQIEGAVSELKNGLISPLDLVTEGDRRATDAVNKYKTENPNPNTPPNPTNPTIPIVPAGETPAEKKLRELEEKFAALEKKDQETSLRNQLLAKMKDKKIPERFAKGVTLDETTDLDALTTTLEAEFKTFRQEIITEGLKNNEFVPGNGGQSTDSTAVSADITAWAKANEPTPPAAAAK